ncbi:MAG TPA: hypothetical protein VFW92_08265 [Candidatus Limnocylindrales bacterium]|nr:hypothetical protein [Candidatus Limnocylindrales bacterium]
MRKTVTLDPDTEALIRQMMREHGWTFKQAVNTAIRQSSTAQGESRSTIFPTYDMGLPLMPLDQALRLAADDEDQQRLRTLRARQLARRVARKPNDLPR